MLEIRNLECCQYPVPIILLAHKRILRYGSASALWEWLVITSGGSDWVVVKPRAIISKCHKSVAMNRLLQEVQSQ
jgi:hypothetical protein